MSLSSAYRTRGWEKSWQRVIDVKPGQTLTEEEINAFIERALPRYKRPRKIIFDKVPRNATGKIEKTKLRIKYGGN